MREREIPNLGKHFTWTNTQSRLSPVITPERVNREDSMQLHLMGNSETHGIKKKTSEALQLQQTRARAPC